MGAQVPVIIKGDGEFGGGVHDIEGEGVVKEGLPETWGGRLNNGFAVDVVACDVPGDAREVGGELGLVSRALRCHL